jgi:non-specific serine/threonine protein kinase
MTFPDIEQIRNLTSHSTYRRALALYMESELKLVRLSTERIDGKVYDSEWQLVSIFFTKGTPVANCSCEKEQLCEHSTAILLQAIRFQREHHPHLSNAGEAATQDDRALIYHPPWQEYFDRATSGALSAPAIAEKTQWIPAFILAADDEYLVVKPRLVYFNKSGVASRWKYLPGPKGLLEFQTTDLNSIISWFETYSEPETGKKGYKIPRPLAHGHILERCLQFPCFADDSDFLKQQLRIDHHIDTLIKFRLRKSGKLAEFGAYLQHDDNLGPVSRRHVVLAENPLIIKDKETIYRIANVARLSLLPGPDSSGKRALLLDNEGLAAFWSDFLPTFQWQEDILVDAELRGEVRSELSACLLYLTEDNQRLYARLLFLYEDVEIVAGSRTTQIIDSRNGNRLTIDRNWAREQAFVDLLAQHQLVATRIQGEFTPRRGMETLAWIDKEIPRLQAHNIIVKGEEKLVYLRINRSVPTVSLNIHSGINWFDVDLDIRYNRQRLDARQFLKAVRDGRNYVALSDGANVRLPEQLKQGWKTLADLYSADAKSLRIHPQHLALLDTAGADQRQVDTLYKQKYEALFTNGELPDYPLNTLFRGQLRPYQQKGYAWLQHLRQLGLGGILADDMGLGKTIQTLAVMADILAENRENQALVIMPASLVFNWSLEIERFLPGVSFLRHTGTQRTSIRKDLLTKRVILTTYGIIRQDWKLLEQIEFAMLVLDESQNIKNPLSLAARAVGKMRGRFRLALSGTPVENTTIDMWSQMNFVNPGILGGLSYFRKNFAIPIEKENDRRIADLLQRLLQPVVLRRAKEVVEPDLPPKTEQILVCEMTGPQAKYYNAVKDDYRQRLMREFDSSGLQRSKLRVVEYLTRIRQICNDPRLIEAESDLGSGKMNILMGLLDDIIADGHKVLVFSQFVKMLGLIRRELQQRHIRYSYLDGSTRDRERVVGEFQHTDDIPVFLISIKAGGTGLNLTAADYVIQVDPWWNPAVQDQATDRAHRIGQERKVMVYKLVTHDSVEEKIMALQERKSKLSQSILKDGNAFVRNLSKNEILELFADA